MYQRELSVLLATFVLEVLQIKYHVPLNRATTVLWDLHLLLGFRVQVGQYVLAVHPDLQTALPVLVTSVQGLLCIPLLVQLAASVWVGLQVLKTARQTLVDTAQKEQVSAPFII